LRVRIEHFGANRQLLGAFHVPQRLQPRSTAVLLCNPFGEEASRSHRTFRVLATQLERAGFSALRFDYAGTGDSLGSSEDVSIDQWVRDIGIAAQKLLDVSGARGIALVGLRFGASLAMLASARGDLRPRHLLMWDPIVDGGAYLRELVAQHAAYMRDELGPGWKDRTRKHPSGLPAEAFGAPISSELADAIAAIDLTRTQPAADQVSVVSTKASADAERLRAQLPHATWIDVPESTAWNSDAALNSMIVPMEIVQTLLAQLEKAS
jgi:alpha-beta hydrolase superfamily lysophospholipase